MTEPAILPRDIPLTSTTTGTVVVVPADEGAALDIFPALWRQRMTVLVTLAATLAAALIYLHIVKPSYTVTLKVAPVASGRPGLSDRVSSLAGLAGISLPTDNSQQNFTLYLDSLTSRETAAALLANKPLMRAMFPLEWDDAHRQWRKPPESLTWIKAPLKSLLALTPNEWRPPDAARVQQVLQKAVIVTKTRETPVVTITTQTGDPDYGRALLMSVHAISDARLQQHTLARATNYIAYLNERVATTSIAEYRQALFQSIIEQEKSRMAASSNLPFAAEPLGPAWASPRPTEPATLAVIGAGLVAGIFFGALAALLRDRRRALEGARV